MSFAHAQGQQALSLPRLLESVRGIDRFQPDIRLAYAEMLRCFYETVGKRTGTTAQAVFERFPLEIRAEALPQTAASHAADLVYSMGVRPARPLLDSMLAEARAGAQWTQVNGLAWYERAAQVAHSIAHKRQVSQIAGQLHLVEIPSDETMLDWDLPFERQPAAVREALEAAYFRHAQGEDDSPESVALHDWRSHAGVQLSAQFQFGDRLYGLQLTTCRPRDGSTLSRHTIVLPPIWQRSLPVKQSRIPMFTAVAVAASLCASAAHAIGTGEGGGPSPSQQRAMDGGSSSGSSGGGSAGGRSSEGRSGPLRSENFTVGKETQRVMPRELKETVRPDGSRSIVTGQTRNAEGKIVGEHSHSIVRDGVVESSRTSGGREVGGSVPKGEGAGRGGGGMEKSPRGGGGGMGQNKE